MTNYHNAQTDAWKHRNDDIDPGPLCGIVIHEEPKVSTRHGNINAIMVYVMVAISVLVGSMLWGAFRGCGN